ncbi:MAG: DUF4145 domain-containing protein [Cyclobacteriaceae bacterium]
MPELQSHLILSNCPHCGIANPSLKQQNKFQTLNYKNENARTWGIYICARCGGVITAYSHNKGLNIVKMYPEKEELEDSIPERAKEYLEQAINSIHAPAGAIMLTASSVDSMLKAKGLKDGKLYSRIKKAVEQHLITKEMSDWAHEVRLDANDQRHADEEASLPTEKDAERAIDFTKALGQFLFVLPSRVQRGIQNAQTNETTNGS